MSLSDEIATMVHAFGDRGRKDAVRALAAKVAELEAALDDASRVLGQVVAFGTLDAGEEIITPYEHAAIDAIRNAKATANSWYMRCRALEEDVEFHKRNAEGNWRDLRASEDADRHVAAPAAIGLNVLEYAPMGSVQITQQQRGDIQREIARLMRQVRVLREALEPFKKRADDSDTFAVPLSDDAEMTLRVGELRRARKALEETKAMNESDPGDMSCGHLAAGWCYPCTVQLRRDRDVLREALGRVRGWTLEHGAALKPSGADTYGNGMRDAKQQVGRILALAATKEEP